MSTYHISLVATEVAGKDSEKSINKITDFLHRRQIIASEATYCVHDPDKLGYAPGQNFLSALAHADACQGDYRYSLDTFTGTNGLQTCSSKCVAMNNQGLWQYTTCPRCAERAPQDKNWSNAVTRWHKNPSKTELHCSKCNVASDIRNWDNDGDLALGELSLTFWNWPKLGDEFIENIQEIVEGNIRKIEGKV